MYTVRWLAGRQYGNSPIRYGFRAGANAIPYSVNIALGPVYMEVGAQVGEVKCGGSAHPSCKRDQTKMRKYMYR